MMNAQHANENLTIHHKVKDYATWHAGYDGHEKSRLSDVTDVAKARTWLDPEIRHWTSAHAPKHWLLKGDKLLPFR